MLVTHEGGRTVRANPEQRQVLGPPKWKKNTLEWYCRRIILHARSCQMIQLKYVLENILYFCLSLNPELKLTPRISEYDLTEGPLEKYSDALLFSWSKSKCNIPWATDGALRDAQGMAATNSWVTNRSADWLKKNSDDWIGWWFFFFTPRHSYILLANMHLNLHVKGGWHLLDWIM